MTPEVGLVALLTLASAGVYLWRGAKRLGEARRNWQRHVDEALAVVEDDPEELR